MYKSKTFPPRIELSGIFLFEGGKKSQLLLCVVSNEIPIRLIEKIQNLATVTLVTMP